MELQKGKEPQQIQRAITSADITHTVTLQKIKFYHNTEMFFLIKVKQSYELQWSIFHIAAPSHCN